MAWYFGLYRHFVALVIMPLIINGWSDGRTYGLKRQTDKVEYWQTDQQAHDFFIESRLPTSKVQSRKKQIAIFIAKRIFLFLPFSDFH